MARTNGRTISSAQRTEIRTILQRLSAESETIKEANPGVSDLFLPCYRRRTFILVTCWVSSIVTYYALTLNVGKLSGDIFSNYSIALAIDLPAHFSVFLFVDRLGKLN